MLSVHVLLETFSVLTRLPAPLRMPPRDALLCLRENFSRDLIAGLTPQSSWSSIEQLAERGLGGGRVYDAAIASSVLQAGATILLTWNVRDLLAVAPQGLERTRPLPPQSPAVGPAGMRSAR